MQPTARAKKNLHLMGVPLGGNRSLQIILGGCAGGVGCIRFAALFDVFLESITPPFLHACTGMAIYFY